jgi:nucleoid DNA-binding protein
MDQAMNHRQLVSAVARRFPDLTQYQIAEVLDVVVEVWRSELAQSGGEVVIRDFGRLTVEVQRMKNGGAVRNQMGSSAPERLTRLYFRFRPTPGLRNEIELQLKEKT